MLTRNDVRPASILDGSVVIEIYQMKNEGDCARLIERGETADFYDVSLRPSDWGDTNGEPYEEHEDLTLEGAEAVLADLEAALPGIDVEWIEG